MKQYTNAIERISAVIALLLASEKNNNKAGAGISIKELSDTTGIPVVRIRDDISSLLSFPFFEECITITDSSGNEAFSDDTAFFRECDDIYIKLDADLFRYGYSDEQIAVMLTRQQRCILSSKGCEAQDNLNPTAYNINSPVRVRFKISDSAGSVIKKVKGDFEGSPDFKMEPSETQPTVFYCEDIVYDKNEFLRKLFEYGHSAVILEPAYLVNEFRHLITEIIQRIDEALN